MPLAAAAPFLYLRREPPPHPLNPPAKGRQNLLNPLNPGHPVAPMGDTITLGPKGPGKLKPPRAQRAGQTSGRRPVTPWTLRSIRMPESVRR